MFSTLDDRIAQLRSEGYHVEVGLARYGVEIRVFKGGYCIRDVIDENLLIYSMVPADKIMVNTLNDLVDIIEKHLERERIRTEKLYEKIQHQRYCKSQTD